MDKEPETCAHPECNTKLNGTVMTLGVTEAGGEMIYKFCSHACRVKFRSDVIQKRPPAAAE